MSRYEQQSPSEILENIKKNKKRKAFVKFVGGDKLIEAVIGDWFKQQEKSNNEDQVALPPRAQICDEAAKLINGDRNKSYGDPAINLKAAQLMQNSFFDSYFEANKEINPEDEAWSNAIQNVFIKLGRIATGEFKKDSYADCIGYLAIAYELALRAQQEKEERDE